MLKTCQAKSTKMCFWRVPKNIPCLIFTLKSWKIILIMATMGKWMWSWIFEKCTHNNSGKKKNFCFGTLLLHGRPYCVAKKMCHDYSTASEFTFEIHSTFTWRSLIAKNESKDDHLKKNVHLNFHLILSIMKDLARLP